MTTAQENLYYFFYIIKQFYYLLTIASNHVTRTTAPTKYDQCPTLFPMIIKKYVTEFQSSEMLSEKILRLKYRNDVFSCWRVVRSGSAFQSDADGIILKKNIYIKTIHYYYLCPWIFTTTAVKIRDVRA